MSDSGASSSTAKSAKLTFTAATNARKAADEARDTHRKTETQQLVPQKLVGCGARKTDTLESSVQTTIETSTIRSGGSGLCYRDCKMPEGEHCCSGKRTRDHGKFSKGEVVGTAVSGAFGKLLSYDLVLEAKVPESDITKAKTGQSAEFL